MRKLNLSSEEQKEYAAMCKKQISMAEEVKARIERTGEWYKGELDNTLECIKNYSEMLKLIEK